MRSAFVEAGLGVLGGVVVAAAVAVAIAFGVLVSDGVALFPSPAVVGACAIPLSTGVMVGTRVGVLVLGMGVKVDFGVLAVSVGLGLSLACSGVDGRQAAREASIRAPMRDCIIICRLLCVILVSSGPNTIDVELARDRLYVDVRFDMHYVIYFGMLQSAANAGRGLQSSRTMPKAAFSSCLPATGAKFRFHRNMGPTHPQDLPIS